MFNDAKFWADQRKAKVAECGEINGRVTETDTMITEIKDFYAWSYAKAANNTAQVTKMGNAKCDEIKLWLDSLAHNNLTLEMVDFLTAAIEQAKAEEFVSQTNFL